MSQMPGATLPTDLWVFISSFIDPWEVNPFLLLKCSHISRAARAAYLRPSLWKNLNPAGKQDPAAHFIATLGSLSPTKRGYLRQAWQYQTFLYTHGSLEKVDLLVYKMIRNELPRPFLENEYYHLGILVSTGPSEARMDVLPLPISDPQMLRCAVGIMPLNWHRAVPALQQRRDLALAAVSTPFPEFDTVKETRQILQKIDGFMVLCRVYTPILSNTMFTEDKDLLRAAVRANWRCLQAFPAHFREDREFLLELIAINCKVYRISPPEIRMDPHIVLDVVKRDKYLLRVVPDTLITREVLMAAFDGTKSNVRNVDFKLNGTETIAVPEIIKRTGHFVKALGLSGDKELLMRLVKWSGLYIQFASPELKADEVLLETAIGSDGAALDHIDLSAHSEEYRIKLFELAVRTRPDILCYYPDYRNNAELVYTATQINGIAYIYASHALRRQRPLYQLAMQTNPIAASVAPREFVTETHLIQLAQTHPIQAARAGRLNTKPLIMASLAVKPQNPAPIDSELRDDSDIALATVELDGLQYGNLTGRLQRDVEVTLAALTQTPEASQYIPEHRKRLEYSIMFSLRATWQVMREEMGDIVLEF